eukprot:scaffold27148_cov36-Phaeocystis_antarctica.AAC.2
MTQCCAETREWASTVRQDLDRPKTWVLSRSSTAVSGAAPSAAPTPPSLTSRAHAPSAAASARGCVSASGLAMPRSIGCARAPVDPRGGSVPVPGGMSRGGELCAAPCMYSGWPEQAVLCDPETEPPPDRSEGAPLAY